MNRKVCLSILIPLLSQLSLSSAENQFHFSSYKKNWFQANEYCHQLGMRLAIIDSPVKHEAVIREAKATQRNPQENFGGYIGASDLGLTGTFIWHGTGERVNFAKWQPGEPSGGSEHCVVMHYWPEHEFLWTWNDGHCTTPETAICERIEPLSCIQTFK